jgi:hypothetical protein
MFLRGTVPQKGAVPWAVIAIQTFGDFLGSILIFMFFARMAVFTARGSSRVPLAFLCGIIK